MSKQPEYFVEFDAEFRAEGRTVEGVALRYADTAWIGVGLQERFEPGCFNPIGDVILNLHHDRQRLVARSGETLQLEDSPEELRVKAELPETRDADDALEMIHKRIVRGFSVEMRVLEDVVDQKVRCIKKAVLRGIGIVARPAYHQSQIETVRSQPRYWL